MKISHWVLMNKSGMNRVAESICEAEKKLGIDSNLIDIQNAKEWEKVYDADIHVSHTHFPDIMKRRITKPLKLVWVGHGAPEYVFQSSVEAGTQGKYGFGDSWQLVQHWLQTADALVTFWDRHQYIWQSMCDKNTKVDKVSLGVDKEFWKKIPTRGKFQGEPSVFTCENQHYIKWALDLFFVWGDICNRVKGDNPILHAIYMPRDMHRWFFTLANRNGTTYHSHISDQSFGHEDLRNAFNSIDYYLGLVKTGDYNRVSLEANASGATTISYAGNPYSDYWVHEGDQRILATELTAILNGEVEKRKKDIVPDISETAKGMKEIYERLL